MNSTKNNLHQFALGSQTVETCIELYLIGGIQVPASSYGGHLLGQSFNPYPLKSARDQNSNPKFYFVKY